MLASELGQARSAILICDLRGEILQVWQEQPTSRFVKGELIYSAIDHFSVAKASAFLDAVRDNGAALDWLLVIPVAAGLTVMHFGGYFSSDRFVIACSPSRNDLIREFQKLLKSPIATDSPPPDSMAMLLADIEHQGTKDDILFEELSRLNNELVNAYRELARTNAELGRSIQRRDQLLGVIAHDLRNPLNLIVISCHMLDDLCSSRALSETQQKSVARIRRSAEFMTHLVMDLVDHASIESGKLKVELRPHDLVHIVKENVTKNTPLALDKELKVELSFGAEVMPVRVDSHRINQVLDNLIGNAIKFSPSRGVITITLYRDGKNCVAAIRDQGPGVVSSELATIFEPFRRGSEGKSGTGAGLGLAISRALIEAHCGKIWVESEVGRGSIFYLSLPLATLSILESTE